MGIAHCICPEERNIASNLYRLQKAKVYDRERHLSNPQSERMSGTAINSRHILNVRCQAWVLENRDRRLRQEQNDVYIASWSVQNFTSAISLKGAWSRSNWQWTPYCLRSSRSCSCISGHCGHLLEVFRRTSGPPTNCTVTSFENLCTIYVE